MDENETKTMNKPLISVRTFLKRAISALAILPVFGFSKPRKFITRVHRDDIIGLHWIGTLGEMWKVIEWEERKTFFWKGEVINNAWLNYYWAVDLNNHNQNQRQLCAFVLDDDGYCTLAKDTKAFRP